MNWKLLLAIVLSPVLVPLALVVLFVQALVVFFVNGLIGVWYTFFGRW